MLLLAPIPKRLIIAVSVACTALASCIELETSHPTASYKKGYRISYYLVPATAADNFRVIQGGLGGAWRSEVCVSNIDEADFLRFDKIASRGFELSKVEGRVIFDFMEIRVQADDGRFVGFGGYEDAVTSTGAINRISSQAYHEAELLAYNLVKGDECSMELPPR